MYSKLRDTYSNGSAAKDEQSSMPISLKDATPCSDLKFTTPSECEVFSGGSQGILRFAYCTSIVKNQFDERVGAK